MHLSRSSTERGASAVEYALLIAGIAAVIVIATLSLGGVTDAMFQDTCQEIDTAASAGASC